MNYADMSDEGLEELQIELEQKAHRATTHAGYCTYREELMEVEYEMYLRSTLERNPKAYQ